MKRNIMKAITVLLTAVMLFSACSGSSMGRTPVTPSAPITETAATSAAQGSSAALNTETPSPDTTSATPQAVVEIEFWHAMSGSNGDALQNIVDKYNETHEYAKVNAVFQGKYTELFEKLAGASQSGTLPAMTQIYANRLTAYIMNDFVQELDSFINDAEKGLTAAQLADIPPVFTERSKWGDTMYTLPCNKSVYLMFYNEDMLKEAGVPVPTTWGELRAAAETLTKDGVIGVGFNKSVGTDFSYWVEQAGGHLMDENEENITFNSPETIEAYEFVTGMVKDGIGMIAWEESYITGPITRGELAIGFTTTSNTVDIYNGAKDFGTNIKSAEVPVGKVKAVSFSGTDMTMFSTVSEEQKQVAWDFMKFWLDTENTTQWGMESGYLPLTYSGFETAEFKAYLAENDLKAPGFNCFNYGFRDPSALNAIAIHQSMQAAIEKIVLEDMDIAEAINEAEAIAVKEMADARANFK